MARFAEDVIVRAGIMVVRDIRGTYEVGELGIGD